jgi:hypothetical protein
VRTRRERSSPCRLHLVDAAGVPRSERESQRFLTDHSRLSGFIPARWPKRTFLASPPTRERQEGHIPARGLAACHAGDDLVRAGRSSSRVHRDCSRRIVRMEAGSSWGPVPVLRRPQRLHRLRPLDLARTSHRSDREALARKETAARIGVNRLTRSALVVCATQAVDTERTARGRARPGERMLATTAFWPYHRSRCLGPRARGGWEKTTSPVAPYATTLAALPGGTGPKL